MSKMSKETKIKRRLKELTTIYSKLPEKKRSIAEPLIKNAAFMEVELEELRVIIAQNGASEEYKNGENQYGRKASADLQSYNSLLKSYNMVNSRLEAMLPPEEETDELTAFLEGNE
ncbi:MAG TPA: hypothetical protein DHW39_11655 [Erysipelotrichaceae bacterium]|nr:hypothetical protein [Erysipelotrichaceae bacterium]HCK89436.1 hypothetical protein [Erysipelotrichaceae bacterium]